MQFHLNGFKPGDPEISEAASRTLGRGRRMLSPSRSMS